MGIREVLAASDFDILALRPWLENGKSVRSKIIGTEKRQDAYNPGQKGRPTKTEVPVYQVVPSDVEALNTKEEFIQIDVNTLRGAKFCMGITHTLLGYRDGILKFGLPEQQATGKTILEYEEQSLEEVQISSAAPAPVYHLVGLPLPITNHSWKSKSYTEIQSSYQPGASGRRVGELIEKTVLGVVPDSCVYGLMNHPGRSTINITDTESLVDQIYKAITILENKKFLGPYFVFHGNRFDASLDSDYVLRGDPQRTDYGQTITQRDAIRRITRKRKKGDSTEHQEDVVIDCKRMDHAYNNIVVVQATPDVIRIVIGLDITTVRWEDGYSTWAIVVPNIRADYNGNVGIAHLRRQYDWLKRY